MSKFKDLINDDKPVLVDFTADWCGPCKILSPILAEVKADIGNDVNIIKVDVDKNPAAAAAYKVQGVPTLIIFKKGEIKWRQSGVIPKTELLEKLKEFV